MTTRLKSLTELQPLAGNELVSRALLFRDGLNETNDGRSWTFDEASARSVIQVFTEREADIVTDYRHLSVNGSSPRDGIAAGWIRKPDGLEYVRGEGLYARINWLPDAAEDIRSGRFRYLSPDFDFIDNGPRPVVQLNSVALTNRPAMNHIGALANSKTPNDKEVTMTVRTMAELRTALKPHTALADTADEGTVLTEAVRVLSTATTEQGIATYVRSSLGLPETANKDAVAVAMTQLRDRATVNADRVTALETKVADFQKSEKQRATTERMEKAYREHRLLRDTDEAATYQALAESDAALFDKLIASKAPHVKTGTTTPPDRNTAGTTTEDTMIANAMTECGGDKIKALRALQAKIYAEPEFAQLNNRAKAELGSEKYPKIFGTMFS